MIKVIKKK